VTLVNENGDIITTEVIREGVRKLKAYVGEIYRSNAANAPINVDKVHASVLKLWNVVQSQPGISEEQVSRIKDLYDSVINSLNSQGPETKLKAAPQPRTRRASSQFLRPQVPGCPSGQGY
jgi:fatty acid synthase subunit alpha